MSRIPLDLEPIKKRALAAEGSSWINGGDCYVLLKDDGSPIADEFHSYSEDEEPDSTPDEPLPEGATKQTTICRIRGFGRLSRKFGSGKTGLERVRAQEVANLDFIAFARADVPLMIREIEHLRNAAKERARVSKAALESAQAVLREYEDQEHERVDNGEHPVDCRDSSLDWVRERRGIQKGACMCGRDSRIASVKEALEKIEKALAGS